MTWIIGLLTGNPIARLVAKLAGIALAIVSFGAWQRRQGAQGQKVKADLRDLKAHQKTTERMQDADAAMGDDPAVLRDRLRKRDPNVR
jgi:uncharacterized protein HemX